METQTYLMSNILDKNSFNFDHLRLFSMLSSLQQITFGFCAPPMKFDLNNPILDKIRLTRCNEIDKSNFECYSAINQTQTFNKNKEGERFSF